MRYKAEIDYDATSAFDGERCAAAKVRPSTWTKSPALALRHARAMAAVIRAAKAVHSTATALNRVQPEHGPVFDRCAQRFSFAKSKLANATEHLVAVEKEVERG